MKNFRTYGNPPYQIALIHGGPGGAGEMAPVAAHLSQTYSVLEPLQTKLSFMGQIEELKEVLEAHAQLPVVLIGHSYGAFLSFAFASLYPTFVKKLTLVGSGVFEESYAKNIMKTRLSRMTEADKQKLANLEKQLNNPHVKNKDELLAQMAKLDSSLDSYDPLPFDNPYVDPSFEIYEKVWKEVHALRLNGQLLDYGKAIQCPVVAIHGDYDPHPAEGVEIPLSRVLKDFRFILLEKCGHYPWFEKQAKEKFYEILEREIREDSSALE
jgi:pimeloyl-ACP methyl ester carboxylesterase